MYKFLKSDDPNDILGDSTSNKLTDILKTKWDCLHEETGVFRYKINNLQERIVDNKYLLQLNPDRGSKRRVPEHIDNICQPFDENKFNFTKISPKEILFNLVKTSKEHDKHSLIVNVSPISRYHTLLCPSILKCHPQIITEDSLVLALDIFFISQHRDIRIGFNSLCALASVNHLHYHLFFESNTLPVETANCKHLKGAIFCLEDYPVPAFCFQLQSQNSVNETSKEIYKLLSYFLKNSIAHNLIITRALSFVPGDDKEVVRVIIWPRKSSSGTKQISAFNVAICELSGWFPVYNKTEYYNLKTENLEYELSKWKVDNFDSLCEEVQLLF